MKGRTGLELGVGLCHGEQTSEAGAQLGFRCAQCSEIAGNVGRVHCAASASYAIQRLLLEFHVLLAGLDQLGQLVMTLLEQHVDIGPRSLGAVLVSDQAVIDADARHQ